eukprot:6661109-Pyramimonas_sp.AAC.1
MHGSAPGPDGIAYSCCARGGQLATNLIFEVYSLVLRGELPGGDCNHGMAVFLAKGEQALDALGAGIFRAAESTRPITLSNTCNQIVSTAIN